MFLKLNFYLIYLIPIAIILGPATSNIIVSIMGLLFIFYLFKDKLWFIFQNWIVQVLILFWFYLCIISLFSFDVNNSLKTSILYVRFIFFALAIGFFISKKPEIEIYFGNFLYFIIFLVLVDGLFSYNYDYNLLGIKDGSTHIVSGIFGEEYILGSFLSRLLPLLFYFLFLDKNLSYYKMTVFIIFVIFIDFIIFVSGERTAFFYMLLASFTLILLTKKFQFFRLIAFLLSIILVIIVTLTNPKVKSRMVDHTILELGLNDNKEGIYFISELHQDYYLNAYNMFLYNPIIGNGPNSFRTLCSNDSFNSNACSIHPHNTYFQLLAETGLIGFLFIFTCFLILLFIFIRQFFHLYFFKTRKIISDTNICLFTCILITLWPLVPTGNFFSSWLNTLYFLPLGFYFSKFFVNQNTPSDL